MKKKLWLILSVVLLFTFLLTSNVLAMSSPGYAVEWFTPLTGGGGGEAASTNYTVNFTIGQSAIGESSSANYGTGLGYWYYLLKGLSLYLPLVMR
jgi:hypothetical protein